MSQLLTEERLWNCTRYYPCRHFDARACAKDSSVNGTFEVCDCRCHKDFLNCDHESVGYNDGPDCAVCELGEQIESLHVELTSRNQEIERLRLEVASRECKCACHDDPKHSTVQDWAEANRYHVAKLKDVTAERDALRKANEEVLANLKTQMVDVPRYDLETKPYHEGASMKYQVNGDWIPFDEAMKIIENAALKAARQREMKGNEQAQEIETTG